MQLVLYDQIGRQQPTAWQHSAAVRIARAIEPIPIKSLDAPEEARDRAGPRHRGELVHRGDQEAWQPPVNRLVHRNYREGAVAVEIAPAIHAGDQQVGWLFTIWPAVFHPIGRA